MLSDYHLKENKSGNLCRLFGLFNSGYLHGQWIDDSPISDPGDWVIHDYQGFGDIEIHEFESISTIAEYAEFIAEHEELGQALIAVYGLEDAKVMIEDQYYGCYDSEVDFARQLFDDCYVHQMPDSLICYFDFGGFARDLFISDYYAVDVAGNTYVFSSY